MSGAPIRGAQLEESEDVDEVINGDEVCGLRIERLVLPETEEGPPLAIERTVSPRGPSKPPVILVHGFAQNRYTWRVSHSFSGALAARGRDVSTSSSAAMGAREGVAPQMPSGSRST